MITRTTQAHPSITRERVDKALSPIYLTDANSNLFNIRYRDRKPITGIRCLSFPHARDPVDGHTLPRPSFAEDFLDRLSEFVPIHIGYIFRGTWTTHWLHLKFILPEEWQAEIASGAAKPHLIFDSNSEAAVFNTEGIILQGLTGGDADKYRGNRRAEFLITPDLVAADGKSVELFIEVACNKLFGFGSPTFISNPPDDATFTLTTCELALLDTKADKLFWHYSTLRDLSETAPKGSHVSERAALVANGLLNIIDRRDRRTFDAAIKLAEEHILLLQEKPTDLSALHPLTHKVFAVGHCHIDNVWLWFENETHRKVARSWSSQLRYFKHHDKDFTFVASQTAQYRYLQENHPVVFDGSLREAIRSGRFIPVGSSIVEPDMNVPCGESLVRQILYGAAFARENWLSELQKAEKRRHGRGAHRIPYGDACFWLPDTFGYTPALPQILRQCGLRYFLTQKLSWSLLNKPEHSSFFWQGLDGSCVLAHFPPANDYNSQATIEDVLKSANDNKDLGRVSSSLMVYGNGDGGGGPNLPMFEQLARMGATSAIMPEGASGSSDSSIARYQRLPSMPEVIHGSPRQFFDSLASEAAKSPAFLPTIQGELYLELHQGTLTTHGAIKNFNRRCEVALHDCELLLVLVASRDTAFATEAAATIKRCWWRVLTFQFHDALPGTSIQQVYIDETVEYRKMLKELEDLKQRCIDILSSHITAGARTAAGSATSQGEKKWLVWNTTAAPRTEVVELPLASDDSRLLKQITIPAYSCVTVEARSTPPEVVAGQQVALGSVPKLLDESSAPTTSSLAVETIAALPPASQRPDPSRVAVQAVAAEHLFVVENGIFRVTVDGKNGQIMSLVDYRPAVPLEVIAQQEATLPSAGAGADNKTVKTGANAVVCYSDVPFFWSAWDTMPYHLENGTIQGVVAPPASAWSAVDVVEAGPLRARLRVTLKNLDLHKGGPLPSSSRMQQDIVICLNDPLIRFETAVDWHANDTMLKVEFPISPAIWAGVTTATYECAFGCTERPIHASYSRDMMQYEVAGHRWADLSSHTYGVALLNDGKYGYSSFRDGVIGMSLLKSSKAPDPTADMGVHRFTYALLPHQGHVKAAPPMDLKEQQLNPSVVHAGLALNGPLRVTEAPAAPGAGSLATSFFSVTQAVGDITSGGAGAAVGVDLDRKLSPNVILDTVKLPERADADVGEKKKNEVVLRLYEAYGNESVVDVIVGLGNIISVKGVNLLEELQGKEGMPAEGSWEEDVAASPASNGDALLASAPESVQAAFAKVRGPTSAQASLIGFGPQSFRIRLAPFQIATFIVELCD
jgi:alpha-mannosidase